MERNIEEEIKNSTLQLLEMVKQYCWNNISNNLTFILSNISDVKGENFFVKRKNRNILNKQKKPKNFNEAIAQVKEIYHSIYDINLFVYKSEKHRTIIEIRYFLKSELEPDYLKTVVNNRSMLHCKISKPPYVQTEDSKFDVNWELGGLRHNWNMFWWNRKVKSLY